MLEAGAEAEVEVEVEGGLEAWFQEGFHFFSLTLFSFSVSFLSVSFPPLFSFFKKGGF